MQSTEKLIHKSFPFIFLIFGGIALILGAQNVINGFASANWTTAKAKIVDSRIVQSSKGNSKHSGKKFKPHIEYSYTVENVEYFSERVLFGSTSGLSLFTSSKSDAEQWVQKYPNGSTLNIYYNSNKKSESTIIKGVQVNSFFLPLLGLFFISVCGIILKKQGS